LLRDRTEGWAAGITLLVAALMRLPNAADQGAFLTHLARVDRYVFDFLAEEVLNTRSAETREFLLCTSVLDELTPETCRAVAGRADSADLLEYLYRGNLFVVAVDEAGMVY